MHSDGRLQAREDLTPATAAKEQRERRPRPLIGQLWFLVLLGTVAGALMGWRWPAQAVQMQPFGDAFVSLVRMIIGPIIFVSVVHGIAGMADMARVGRVALKALIYFEVLTIALLLGLVAVNVFAPGGMD